MKKKKTKKHRKHHDLIAQMGCVICRGLAIPHHCVGGSMQVIGYSGMSQRGLSDWLVIPLCPNHHTGDEGFHHLGVETWERKYGKQLEFLHMVNTVLSYDLWEQYRLEQG